jgi:hypothetical protein
MGQAKTAKAPPVKAVKPQEAGRFVLKDSLGRTRAELGLFADRPALVLYDYAANRILSLGAEPDGALTLMIQQRQNCRLSTARPAGAHLLAAPALNLARPPGPLSGTSGRTQARLP